MKELLSKINPAIIQALEACNYTNTHQSEDVLFFENGDKRISFSNNGYNHYHEKVKGVFRIKFTFKVYDFDTEVIFNTLFMIGALPYKLMARAANKPDVFNAMAAITNPMNTMPAFPPTNTYPSKNAA